MVLMNYRLYSSGMFRTDGSVWLEHVQPFIVLPQINQRQKHFTPLRHRHTQSLELSETARNPARPKYSVLSGYQSKNALRQRNMSQYNRCKFGSVVKKSGVMYVIELFDISL